MPRGKPTQPGTELRLSIRLDLPGGARVGPGKIALLEAIGREGSISAGGRALRMSYRRAWALVEELNATLGFAVVVATTGGAGGGGARLTPQGEALVAGYRAVERGANALAARQQMAALKLDATPPVA